MFKAGDKLNPYDPAAMEGWENPEAGVEARFAAGNHPAGVEAQKMLGDPSSMAMLLEMLKADAAERKRTGETVTEQMLREKREWAEADARSAKVKLEANAAFRKGDFKDAFVLYTVCMKLSPQEPVYALNRAAAGLKLQMYEDAVEDTERSIELNFNLAKAFYRRGSAYRLLGSLDDAERDLTQATVLAEEDETIRNDLEHVKKLQDLDKEELDAWVLQQGAKTEEDVFPGDELERRVKERIAQKD